VDVPGPHPLETFATVGPSPARRLPPYLRRLAARYGPMVRFRLLGGTFFLVSNPQWIGRILVADQHRYTKNRWTMRMNLLLGEGLLTSSEPLHRKMRRIVQPAFHSARIAGYALQMQQATERFGSELTPEPFDMHAAMTELTLRIASQTLFGRDASGSAASVSTSLHGLMTMFPTVLNPLGELRLRFPLPWTRRFNALREELDDVVMRLIAARRAEGEDTGDALSMLMTSHDAETGETLDDRQVRDEAMTLFLAGHETTANALTWTWYLLAEHPEAEARVREELFAVDADPTTMGAAEAFPYTMAVLRESMRLYPPAWLIGRTSLEDVEVGPYHMPAGSTVLLSPLVVHRQPGVYSKPDEFVPERWLQNAEVPPFAYFPFGGGSRRCIGEQFAWMEMLIVLVTLGRRFRFVRTAADRVKPHAIVTLRPSGPVPMRYEMAARPRRDGDRRASDRDLGAA